MRQAFDGVRLFRLPRRLCLILLTLGAAGIGGALMAAAFFHITAAPKKGPYGPYAQLPVVHTTLHAKDLPRGLDTRFPTRQASSSQQKRNGVYAEGGGRLERAVSFACVEDNDYTFTGHAQNAPNRGLIRFSRGQVSIATVDGFIPVARLRQASQAALRAEDDPFAVDMFAPPAPMTAVVAPLLYGESMDESGTPSRWTRPDNAVADANILACGMNRIRSGDVLRSLIRGLGLSPSNAVYTAQADRYRTFIRLYAEKYDLAAALVLAIMHTESNFNPFAVSPNQAVGLMQIVPDTAGNEVYRYLMGTQGTPSLETLFTPEHNIRYGTAYLHLLGRRYFGGVNNSTSRQMCIIAAYNGGPGAVLRLFDSDPDYAVDRINALTPEQVYMALTTEMPKAETRRYVEIVMGRMQNYATN